MIHLDELYAAGIQFFQNHTIPAVAILVVFAIFAFVKPKALFKFLLLGAVLGLLFYLFSFLLDSMTTGIEQKNTLSHKSGKNLE